MQSYGIIGVTLWIICGVSTGKRQYPYVETVVSRLRNSRFLPWKLSCPAVETVVSCRGNGKLMHTINFFPPGELAYARLILCCRYFDLQPICNSICNDTTVCQLVYYTRLVAGDRCFYVFSTL